MKLKRVDYSKYPESDIIVNYIVQRFMKGLYTFLLTIGLPGTGKSSTDMRLGELITERINAIRIKKGIDITIDIYVADSLIEFIEWLQKARPGDCVIIEELSVLFPSRRSMAGENVAIGRVLDTCRKKQVIILSNAPILKSIDSHVRAMAHICVETLKIVKSQKVVVSKAHKLQTNPGSGKTYLHTFQRNGRDVKRTYTYMPDINSWNKYENKKDKFMDSLYKELKAKAEKKREKLNKEMGILSKDGTKKPLTEKQLATVTMIDMKGMTRKEAAKEQGVSVVSVGKQYRAAHKKLKFEKVEK